MPDPLLDLKPEHLTLVLGILHSRIPGTEVWAFGSRVKGTAKPYSDLDLAVITDVPLELEVFGILKEDFLESDLPFKVDVIDWAATGQSFRDSIERDRLVVQAVK